MKKLSETDILALSELCHAHSFAHRGRTYFRIIGDGVLQVIKFEYERCFEHYSLDLGLISMYSECEQEDFTASSCIPRYCVSVFINQSTAVSSKINNGIYSYQVMSPQDQIEILSEKGFPWLDTINSSNMLLDALCMLDKGSEKTVRWNDSRKIAPYLLSNRYECADHVIASILRQHLGPNVWKELPWTSQDFDLYACRYPQKDQKYLTIHNWIEQNDTASIQDYLAQNYAKNMALAKFLF